MRLEHPRRRGLIAGFACLGVATLISLCWTPRAISMPDSVRIPIVEPHPEGAPQAPALFRHGRHDSFSCAACHPATFPEWRAGFTHQDMNDGRFCGTCHDGSAATAINTYACEDCHVPK